MNVLAHLGGQAEFHAHLLEHLAAAGHDGFFQLELWNTEGQQTADLRIDIEDNRLDAIANQHVRASQTGRACTNDGNLLVCPLHCGHIRFPAQGKGGVGDVFLDRADGNRTIAVVQRTGTLTETILRTHSTADLRKGVGLMTQLDGPHDVAFGNQLEPVRDVIVNRALPLAIGVTTLKTTVRLGRRTICREGVVDLAKLFLPLLGRDLLGVDPPYFNKLEVVTQSFFHLDALINSISTRAAARPLAPNPLSFLFRARPGAGQ